MNRRSFFRRALPSAVVGAAVAPAIIDAVSASPDLPDEIVVDGITCRWLGWRVRDDQDVIWGVWLFTLPDARMTYSTSSGIVSRDHQRGHVFDASVRDNLWLTSQNDSSERRRELRTAAYDRGLADVRKWMTEPPAPKPEYGWVEMCATGLPYMGDRWPNSR